MAAVDVLAVGLQHQENVDEVAGLDFVAHTHDFVGLDRHGAFAFGNTQGEAGNQLAFEQGRTLAQVDHRDAASQQRSLFESPCWVDRQLFHAQGIGRDRLTGWQRLGRNHHGESLHLCSF
ncbi:hypothetical protein D3C87_1453100 [compost metagenome]